MTTLSPTVSVGTWAAEHPEAIPVFERYGIDFCCGGDRPLEEACRRAGIDQQRVADEIAKSSSPPQGKTSLVWTERPLSEFCDHIVQTHHAYLRGRLPQLTRLLEKVVSAHGERHPGLHDLQTALADLVAELEPHMFKEERILFPAVRMLERSETPPAFLFGTVQNPIAVMIAEHDHAGDGLREIRRITEDYLVPSDACPTYRALLTGLAELEADLHEHIHKENNILFPRAAELERGALDRQQAARKMRPAATVRRNS